MNIHFMLCLNVVDNDTSVINPLELKFWFPKIDRKKIMIEVIRKLKINLSLDCLKKCCNYYKNGWLSR